MITDARSAKVSQSIECELCWWFPLSSEQYRIGGKLHYVGPDESSAAHCSLRQEMWRKLSDRAREQFYWVKSSLVSTNPPVLQENAPRSPFKPEQISPTVGSDSTTVSNILEPPDLFLLVLLEPWTCDYLRLRDNFRQIDQLNLKDAEPPGWTSSRVNP